METFKSAHWRRSDARRAQRVEVCLFGPVRIRDAAGVESNPPSASQRRMLGLLASRLGEPLTADEIGDLLEISPGTVRMTISRLRCVIGRGLIVNGPNGYWLDVETSDAERLSIARHGQASSDTHSLRERTAVLASVQGKPLDEFAHEEWARVVALRLGEVRSEMIEQQAESLLAAQQPEEAIGLLRSHIQDFPFRDRPRELLIEGLARAGRQVDSLRAYEEYRSFLAEEVGLDPSQQLRELYTIVASRQLPPVVSLDLRDDAPADPQPGPLCERCCASVTRRSRDSGLTTEAVEGKASA